MSNICTNGIPGGINGDCLSYPKPITNFIVTDASVSFTLAQLTLLSQWKSKIQTDETMFVPFAISKHENTTDDPAINTTQMLQKVLTKVGVPSYVFSVESNFCDWNEAMRTLRGNSYRLFTVHSDGAIFGFSDRNSTEYKGFLCEITAITKGQIPDAIEDAFPVYVNFKRYAEFEQQFAFVPEWNVELELPAAMPSSYKMKLISASQATKTMVVSVYNCAGAAATGLVIADVEVISSTLTDDTVFAMTDNSDGTWDIVYTTVALNEDVTVRIKELTATIIDAVSNPIYHEFIA